MSNHQNQQQNSMPQPSYSNQDPSIDPQSGYNTPQQMQSQPTSTYSFSPQSSQPSLQSQDIYQVQQDVANLNLNRQQSTIEDFHGPYLKFNGVLDNVWYGSVLIVSRATESLVLIDGQSSIVQPLVFHTFKDFKFQRFSFSIPLQVARNVSYQIQNHPETWNISVPAANEPLRVLWHSCNGFSSGVDEKKFPFDGLWNHVLKQHTEKPYHCQMGGGDQLYADKVFDEAPSLVSWIKIVSKRKRETHEWTEEMNTQVDDWYFRKYIRHFELAGFKQAIAEIPYSFVCDDHDLYDGYGSYPDRLQNCPVFQGVFNVAYKYYLLFQQQLTQEMARGEGYVGDKGNSFIRHLGQKQAVVLVDTRKERSKDTVVSNASWRKIYDAMDQMPTTVEHLFLLLPVPIVYPRLKATEKGLALLSKGINSVGAIRHFTKQFQKNGVFTAMISKFGEPELLDDLCDHWTAHEHKSERKILVEALQEFAVNRNVRISFVGGDVHCAGAGRFFNSSAKDRELDAHDMTQIISSAIVNEPPPDAVINVLHVNEKLHHLNTRTKEEMFEIFGEDVDGKKLNSKKLMRRRNFARSEMKADGSILVELHVEQENVLDAPHIYPVPIPKLKRGNE